ncbi:hypothetical protein J2X68_004662 [Streptomyces sp. 3330]|nr:hypothetical protein [Streptomyces sp. 3330]
MAGQEGPLDRVEGVLADELPQGVQDEDATQVVRSSRVAVASTRAVAGS